MNSLNNDYQRVFEACEGYCAGCQNCAKKCKNDANLKPGEAKNLQNSTFLLNGIVCDSLLLLTEIANVNLLTSTSQFERVKYYFDIKDFLNENCCSWIKDTYNKKFLREWAQVVLYTFNALPNICKIIEDIVDERASARSLAYGLNVYNENTYLQIENMLDLMDRKSRLINMHVRIKRAVSQLPAKLLETAKIRFFDRRNIVQMSQKLKISIRTCQRRTEKLLDEFSSLMQSYGLDASYIFFEIGKFEPWMLEWFRLDLKTL